jgi:hypothetical protein
LQFARAIAKPKIAKEYVFSNAPADSKVVQIDRKMTGNKEHQPLTSGMKHWGLSGYSSALPRIKFGVTRQESSTQSPTISYRQSVRQNYNRG